MLERATNAIVIHYGFAPRAAPALNSAHPSVAAATLMYNGLRLGRDYAPTRFFLAVACNAGVFIERPTRCTVHDRDDRQ